MLQLHWRVVLRDDRTDAADRVVWTGILLRGEIRCHGTRDPVLSPRQLLPSRSGTAYSVSKQLIRKSCLVSFCLFLPCLSFRVLSYPVLSCCLVLSSLDLYCFILYCFVGRTDQHSYRVKPSKLLLYVVTVCYSLFKLLWFCDGGQFVCPEFQSLFDL